jgi:hypothetical protein
VADLLRRYTDRRSGVPWIRTTARIWGQRQIATFEALCAMTGRRPHELVSDIVLDELWALGDDPEFRKLAREAREHRRRALLGEDGTDG